MNKTRLIQAVATFFALYGGCGAFMADTGREWTMFLFPLAAMAAAAFGALPRAVVSAFIFSLSALCAMIAWRAMGRGTPEWFLVHYGMLSLFWLGMSALTAAPLFEASAVAPAPQVEPEAEPALEAELA